MQRRRRDHERGLHRIAHELPRAASATDRVTDLARDQGAGDKYAEADADVAQGEQCRRGARCARLVVGEAVVIGEGGDVLHAGGECEEEEFGFDEDVDADGGGEVGEELLDKGP